MGAPRARRVCGAPFGEESPDRRPKKAKAPSTKPNRASAAFVPGWHFTYRFSHKPPKARTVFHVRRTPCRAAFLTADTVKTTHTRLHPCAAAKAPAPRPDLWAAVIKNKCGKGTRRKGKRSRRRAERSESAATPRRTERSESAAASGGFKKIYLRHFAARLLAKKAPTADRKRRGWRQRGCSNFCRRPKPAPLSMFGGHLAVPLFSQPTR